jgi:hypothetical protein
MLYKAALRALFEHQSRSERSMTAFISYGNILLLKIIGAFGIF